MPNWTGTWKGGRIYVDRDGRHRYVIERMRHRKRYTITLPVDCADPELSLMLFTRDPDGFASRVEEATSRPDGEVVLTLDSIAVFEKAMRESSKELSEAHIRSVIGYLKVWCDELAGRDLRKIPVDTLRELRDRHTTARNYRTVALKAYCTWLVKRQRLVTSPAAHLEQVRAKPKRLGGDVVYSKEQIEAFYSILKPQRVRDMFLLVAKTGLHGSEAARIAGSECQMYELPDKSAGIAAVVTVRHKSKRDHRQALDAQGLAAVRRLQAAGGAPCKERIHEAIVAASRKANCPPVFLRYLRHSFITLANESGREVRTAEGGVPLATVAAAVGHRSMLMAKDHYLGSKVPPMIAVPLNLKHPEDPIEISAASVRAAR